jgi:predicted dehydrogenase
MPQTNSRRDFLKSSAAVSAGVFTLAGLTPSVSLAANETLRIAGIGVGGKGHSDILQAGHHGDVVAICDIDVNHLMGALRDLMNPKDSKAKRHNPKAYYDYRKMFDEMGKSIDAVTVSTPDHTHAPASLMAMKLGKHVYCQKPLTHSVAEARQMRETARKMKVCTQMGNQGTAEDGLRRAVEIIRAGVLGQVKEVHVWTNRPIWPQGADAILRVAAARGSALAALHGKSSEFKTPSVPKHVYWDEFLGTAPERPYDPIYHPFSWRGWWDFGTGALGDMACHTANMAFMALKLGYPTSIVATEVQDLNPETGPTGARIVFQFPEREGMAPLKFTWHEGIDGSRRKYLPDAAFFRGEKAAAAGGGGRTGRRGGGDPTDVFSGLRVAESGSLLVGEKGTLYSPDDYGARYYFLGPNAKDIEEAAKKVSQSLPRNGKGDDGMKEEWVAAIKNGKPEIAMSNFDYAAMLTETILLGNVAIRSGKDVKLDWDGPNMKVTNRPEAERFVRTEYRRGWQV